MTIEKTHRFYALDILKFIWLMTIIHFHVYETYFYSNELVLNVGNSFFSFLHYPIRALAFSGFAIVTLTSFLVGWVHLTLKKWLSLMGILALGAFFLAWLNGDEQQFFYLQWDIYNFHFASFLIIALLQTHKKLLYGVSILFFPLLFFPVWEWDYLLDGTGWLKDALIGDCIKEGHGSWPLIPWLAMPLGLYSIANIIKSNTNYKQRIRVISSKEFMVWATLLIVTLPWLNGYFNTPIGSQFSCYVHRRPPIYFWSHWMWVVFFIRIGFLDTVNNYLKNKKWVQFISSLEWSKNMGLAYAIHFIFLNLGSYWIEAFQERQYLLDIFNFSMILGVEWSCRGLRWAYQKIAKKTYLRT